MKRVAALPLALLLALGLPTGCGSGEKVAVRINKDVVTEDEFNKRAQNINGAELYTSMQRGGPAKAGELAMQALILEKLNLQLAADKNALPTDAQVNAYFDYAKKFPRLAGNITQDPFHTEAEIKRNLRVQLALRNITIKPLNISEADLKKIYDEPPVKERITLPDEYHIRIIAVGSEQKAQQVLAALKKNVSFEVAALKMSDDPAGRQKQGDLGFVPANHQILAPVIAAVKNLKPREYTPKPVELVVQNQSGMPQTLYAIAKLEEPKKPGRTPSLDEVKLFLEDQAVNQKDPGSFQRIRQLVQEQIKKADIQVNLKPYEGVAAKLKEAVAGPPAPPTAPPAP